MTSKMQRQVAPARRWIEFLLLGLLLVATLVVRWPYREVALIRDEGEYAHLGQEILRGAVPYADVYNQKTPFVFYLMALIQAVAGSSVSALRLATALYGAATTVVVFLLGRSLFGRGAALASAAAFAVMTFNQCGCVYPSSPEFFMLPWLAAGTWLWYRGRERGSSAHFVLAGAAAGLAYQTKQSGTALLVFFVLDRFIHSSGAGAPAAQRLAAGAKDASLAVLGFALVLGATLAFFAWNGALSQYVECTWTNNWAYIGERHGSKSAATIAWLVVKQVARWDAPLWLLGTVGMAVLAGTAAPSRGRGLWILLAATASFAALSGKEYVHYFEPLIAPLSVGAGVATACLLARSAGALRAVPRRPAAGLALGALALAAWIWPATNVLALSLASEEGRSRLTRISPLFEAAPAIGRYLAERTRPEDTIMVVGSEPEVYFFAGRSAASRLVFTYPLLGPYPYAERLLGEFSHDLESRRPSYVLLVRRVESLTEWPGTLSSLEPVTTFLEAHYLAEAMVLGERIVQATEEDYSAAHAIVLCLRR